jgi:glycerol-3-phosphate dehydrogenase
VPLPGGEATADVAALSRRFAVGLPAAIRLGFRHGARAAQVLAAGGTASVVCACEPVLDAELEHVAQREGVRTLDDCRLRVRLGVGACQGAACAVRGATVLAGAHDWSAARIAGEIERFVEERWRAVAPVLAGDQVGAMEVHRAAFLGARGFHGAEEF